ncbi:hypothetical protein DFP72DRAFT_844208 [Ephemerocybe angulata]|uniref:Uncharacterized protein n=1 Tax=Ephemerocybe angulata TaxID=980116 RepID=A0A8H6MCY0_9AGAR|nr:hypothetical protein DFP72DRAFT_844208 [Tulosesus angulatus]
MVGHVQRFSKLKGLVRGKQFATFSQGKMCAFGERTPRGGAPGDCHHLYDYMGAHSEEALECLFDNAEDSLILSEVARMTSPAVYRQIRAVTGEGEKIGLDSSTLYYCNNYTAAMHLDKDAGPGLCALVELEAELHDYTFINLGYDFYFAPRANSMWSFRGSDVHGTTLPALRLRGGRESQKGEQHSQNEA